MPAPPTSAPPALPRFDQGNQCLWWRGGRVALSANASRMLEVLVDRPGQLLSKGELLDAVWPDAHVVDAVLSVTVSQLREALGDDPRQPRFIETVHRRGYRWIGQLAEGEPGTAPAAVPEARQGPPRDLFVGRGDAEADLEVAARLAAEGHRQVVFVTGEPGVGKTMLVDRFLRSESLAGCLVGRGQCVDTYGFGEPYMPILEALQELARRSDDVVPALRSQAPTWLFQMPGLLAPAEREQLRLTLASSTGERMVRELQYALEELSREHRTVLVLEDLHWSDPATVAALAALAARREPARLLVIASFRPADAVAQLHPVARLRHELVAGRRCVDVALDGLDAGAVSAYLDARFAGHGFPAELSRQLHAQTAGNALFLLNSVDDLEQRGWLARIDEAWRCTVDPRRLQDQVPDSTRAMIESRLGGLPASAQELLEAASVVGPVLTSQALAAVLGREAGDVESAAAALAAGGQYLEVLDPLRWPDGSSGTQYAFRHVLYQQVLYGRVTGARRQAAHRAVAARLESGFAKQPQEVAGALTLHCERGGVYDGAVAYLAMAAQLAQSRYAYEPAIALLRHALDLLALLPEATVREERELELLTLLTACVFAAAGPGAEELSVIGERVDELSKSHANSPRLYFSLIARVAFHLTRGRIDRAEEGALQILARIPKEDWAADIEAVARGQLGFTQQRRGLLPQAIANLEAGRRLPAGRIGIIDSNLGFGSDLAVCILLRGDVDGGLEALRDAEARAEAGGHPPTIAFCLPNAMRVGMFLEDHAMVEEATRKVGALADLLASANVAAYSDLGLGWLRAIRGDADGLLQMQRGREELSRSGYLTYQSYYALQAAVAQLGLGQLDAALRSLDESDELLADTGTRWCEAEVWRIRGELAVARARGRANAEAEGCFRRAAEVAAAQSAQWWESRAWFSLARMLPAGAREAEALPRLRAVASQVRGGESLAPVREIRGFVAAHAPKD